MRVTCDMKLRFHVTQTRATFHGSNQWFQQWLINVFVGLFHGSAFVLLRVQTLPICENAQRGRVRRFGQRFVETLNTSENCLRILVEAFKKRLKVELLTDSGEQILLTVVTEKQSAKIALRQFLALVSVMRQQHSAHLTAVSLLFSDGVEQALRDDLKRLARVTSLLTRTYLYSAGVNDDVVQQYA